MKMLNDRTEKRLMEKSPKAVSLTVGKYAIPRWSIEDAERFTDPLLQHMQANHWAEKQTWLDEQDVPYEILTHSHYDLSQEAAVIHVMLLTTSENAVMFRLTFGG